MTSFRLLLATGGLCAAALGFGMDVSAKSAIIIDAGSGKVLWSKNADSSMYPASTTKIMTALLLIEHCKPTDIITAPADVLKVKESSMHLKPGEQVTVHDMLYALMLRSANDGCYAVATHISGSVEEFAKLMNLRARQAGCTHTHFHNPNGLNDLAHTTTAHDLALMGRAAMQYPEFREVVKTYKYQISRSMNLHDRLMVNHDKLLKKDPSADGIKTGYTVPAGHCFVGSTTRNGLRLITVVLKSNHWQLDDQALANWGFANFEKKESIPAGEVVGSVHIPGSGAKPIPVSLARSAYTIGPKGTLPPRATEEVVASSKLEAPIHKGDKVGDLVIRDADGWIQRVPVVAQQDVSADTAVNRVTKSSGPGSTLFFGGALFVGAYLVKGRARRKIKYYGRKTKRQGF